MEIKDLTEWFPGTVRPNFIGVYEVKSTVFREAGWYAYWSGSGWLPAYCVIAVAYKRRNTDPLSRWQDKVWRGLARPIE